MYEDCARHTDNSKYYFRVLFYGGQPPWLLRALSEVSNYTVRDISNNNNYDVQQKRLNWVSALSQNTQQGKSGQFLNDTDTYSKAVPYPQGNAKRSISLYRKSKKSLKDKHRRYSTPDQNPDQETDYEFFDYGIATLANSAEPERKANDSLPSLPSTSTPVYDNPIPAAVTEFAEREGHYESTDSIYETVSEEQPPPIPARLISDKSVWSTSQIEDEEGYISVPAPMERVATIETPVTVSQDINLPDEGGQDYQNVSANLPSLSTSDGDSVPSIMLHQSLSIEDEATGEAALAKIEADYHAIESTGNLSSLEATSPRPLHAMATIESYFQSLFLSAHGVQHGSLSPISSDDKSSLNNLCPESGANNTCTTSEAPQHLTNEVPTATMALGATLDDNSLNTAKVDIQDSPLHAYDTLQHEYWRHSPDKFTSPVRHDFVLREQPLVHDGQESFHEPTGHRFTHTAASTSLQGEFTNDLSCKDHIPTQMFMLSLQKMQQALEAMQDAYIYMPHSASNKAHDEQHNLGEQPSADATDHLVLGEMCSVADPQEIMTRCLSEFSHNIM